MQQRRELERGQYRRAVDSSLNALAPYRIGHGIELRDGKQACIGDIMKAV
jgi:hypothetical protein